VVNSSKSRKIKMQRFFRNKHKKSWLSLLIVSIFALAFFVSSLSNKVPVAHAAVCTSLGTGNWSAGGNWSCGHAPTAGVDSAVIASGHIVTVDTAATCTALTLNAAGVSNGITISGANSLTVTGAISFALPTAAGVTSQINVGAGSVSAGSVSDTSNNNSNRFTGFNNITTGSLTVTGNYTGVGTGSGPRVVLAGAGMVTIGGNFTLGTFTGFAGSTTSFGGTVTIANFTPSTGTFNYNGGVQTLKAATYQNLTLSGSGAKTITGVTVNGNLTLSGTATMATVANMTIGGNLDVGSGTSLTTGNFTFTVTGTTSVTGTLNLSANNKNTTFTGDVTLNSGGVWNETLANPITFSGSLTNNATTFTAGTGTHTFSGAAKTLSGSTTTSIATVTFPTGSSYTNNGTLTVGTLLTVTGTGVLTNNGTITATTALSGTGGVTQGATGVLNIGGTSGITTITATAVGNTVNYTGAAQTVHSNNYYNLSFSGSLAKTLQAGTTTIGGNLTLSGTATATTVVGLVISGNLVIGNGTTFTAAGFALTVTGTTTVGGGTSGSLVINSATGTKIFTGLVTVANGATWNNSGNSAVTFRGGITTTPTFTGGSGIHTFDTNSQALNGTFSIPSITVTGVTLTNNGTLTVATALTGTGGLTNSGGTLNLSGTSGITTLTASSLGNLVNYNGTTQTIKATTYFNLTISGSGTKTLGGATVVSANLNISAGTLDVDVTNNYALSVGGTWTNTPGGTSGFLARSGTVTFNGTNQTINSANTWYNLAITGTAARTVSLQSSVLQTVSNQLTLTGASGQLLTLAPLTPATTWLIHAPATQTINYVSASYSDASGGTAINAVGGTGNVDGGNNTNWTFNNPPTGTSAVVQNSTSTTVDIVVTGTGFSTFVSSGTTTANATDRANITYRSTNPTAAVINNSTTITLTFAIAIGTDKSGSLTLAAGTVKNGTVPNALITIVDGSITDSAKPVLNTIVKSLTSNQNRLTFTYSEPVAVTNGTSTSSSGDITTAGTVAGFGSFATTGNTTVPTTKNTVAGNGTATITIDLAAQSGGFLNGSSSTEPSGVFTPVGSAAVVDISPATNQVLTTATATVTGEGTWDLIKPIQTPVAPATNAFINNTTTSVSITNSEAITSGTIVATRTGGTADGTVHTCTLLGTGLASGAHTISFADTVNGCAIAQTLVSGAVYTFAFDATDLAGNLANQISNTGITFDNAAPTVTTVVVQTGLTVDVTFDEAMGTGVTTATNYTVSGAGKGTLSSNPNSVALQSGNTYRLTWTAGEMVNGGTITIAVATAQDLAGNPISSSGSHTNGGIGVAPTVTTVAVQTGLTVDITFDEAMGTGVTTASNYIVSGTGQGTLSNNPNSVALVSGNKYRLTWTSGEMKNGGAITITVANAQDLAGNTMGAPNSGTDATGAIGVAPTVSTVAVQTALTVNITFSEAMGTGVTTASNYTVSGSGKGTLASNPNTAVLSSGNTYTLTWSSGEMFNGGNIIITVANAQDLAGNPIGFPNSGTHTGGGIGTAPTVNITAPLTTTKVKADYAITFTDNESTFPQCSIDNSNWVACTTGVTTLNSVTGFGALGQGAFTLYLKDTDAAGNIGTDSEAGILKDTVAPDVTINQKAGQADPTNTSPVYFTVVFNEPINTGTFTNIDIGITGSATTGLITVTEVAPNNGTTFDVSVVVTADGTVIADIAAGGISDLAGNTNTISTSTDKTITYDASGPVITATAVLPSSGTANVGDPLTITITDEAAGYSVGACTVNGIDVSGSFSDDGGGVYSFTYNISEGNSNWASGALPINCTLLDGLGNPSTTTAFDDANTLAGDANSPVISSRSVSPSSGWAKVSDNLTITLSAGETGLSVSACTVNSVNVAGTFIDNLDNTYSLTYGVSEGNSNWTAGNLPINCTLLDAAGNSVTSISFNDANTLAGDANSPAGLTELNTGSTGSTSQVLNWTAVTETNFDHYEIWYGTNETKVQNRDGSGLDGAVKWDNSNDAALATRTTTTTTITGLTPSTTYYFQIWAVDAAGNEETVTDKDATTAGTNSAPILNNGTTDDVLGAVTQLTDESGQVQVKFRVKDADGATDTSNLATGSAQYQVGEGGWSAVADGSITFDSTPFTPATDYTGTEYTLTWNSKDQFNNQSSANVDFRFKVNDGDADSAYGVATGFSVDNKKPVITNGNISIAGGGGTLGAYIVGNTVTVTWNSSAGGDNNSDIATATANLSQFGGGSSVAITDTTACSGSAGDYIYEACYTINGSEGIDDSTQNVSVAATDTTGNTTSAVWDTTNATVDTIVPVVTAAKVKVKSGTCTGTLGACKNGDNPVLQWDGNTDGETDTIASATFNGSSLKLGDSALSGSNVGSNVWEASLSGALDSQEDTGNTVSVTVIDDAGNSTGPITSSASYLVDTVLPTAPGNLVDAGSVSATTITLNFGLAGSDTNFSQYKIFYKSGSGGVTESNTPWTIADDTNLGFANYNSASSTIITGLSASTDYYFNIWIYDSAGNKASAVEVGPISTTSGNSAPAISNVSASQKTDDGFVDITYKLSDADSDPCNIISYQYSLTGAWAGEEVTMTPASGDFDHDGVSSLTASPAGINYTFVWDAGSDLGNVYDGTVYIRLKANDGIDDSGFGVSPSFAVDVKKPVVSMISAAQATDGSKIVTINYNLADDTTSGLLVEIDISSDGGSSWTVTDTSVAGHIGSGVITGSKTITWDAGTDFANQETTTMQVRIRAKDGFQNQGSFVESASTFSVDTIAPNTTVLTNPPLSTTSTSATFTFSSNEAGTFECKLDGGPFATCTTPKNYTNLSVDSHTFEVRAIDAFGNTDATPASYTWTINTPSSSDKAITAFTIPGQVGGTIINEGVINTIAVTMPHGTGVTALVPNITITGSSVNPASGVANNFTTPQTYTVTAADFSTQDYIVTVTIASAPPPSVGYTPPSEPPMPPPQPPIQPDTSKGEKLITNETGGETSLPDGSVKIDIPAGATSENIIVKLNQENNPPLSLQNWLLADSFNLDAYFASNGQRISGFDKEITITIYYGNELSDLEESSLQLYFWDEGNQEWIMVPSSLDTENNILTAKVDHFTTYAIFGRPNNSIITGLMGEYIVQSGEGIQGIAYKLYGIQDKWKRLVELNKDTYPSLLITPNVIYSGWILKYDLNIGGIAFVTEKTYDYELVYQSPYPAELAPGEITNVWIEVKNTGTAAWFNDGTNVVRLGSGSIYGNSNQQRDYASEFANSDWLSPNRPTVIAPSGIIPGWNTRFQFNIKAPITPGTYKAYFTPVADGITWMKDIGIYWEIKVR